LNLGIPRAIENAPGISGAFWRLSNAAERLYSTWEALCFLEKRQSRTVSRGQVLWGAFAELGIFLVVILLIASFRR
jgi:hypothetical protein